MLKIQLRNQISPTPNHFQDIGAIKKKNRIFLKKRKVNEITYSTLFTHMYFGYQFVYSSYIDVCCIKFFTYAVTDYIFLQHILAYGMIIFIINVYSYNFVLCDLL